MRFVMYGSTRSVTDNHGVQESYYDYDIFGSPITGNYTTGTDYGYLGKPYDSITGLYNYGYRDYPPQSVRFTTVDPIRDGSNWFAYVNNDPVNYVDLWGLLASDEGRTVPNTWRDNKDGTYTALPGATLYELYGEHWREESGCSGNPADLQVGDVVGKVNIPKEYTDTQPETIHNMTDTNNSNIVRSYGFGLKMALVLGLGFEVGYVTDGETKAIYITGSYGIGVQVSTGNYSSIEELMNSYKNPSNLFSPSIGSGSVTSGTETSETVDIGVGVVGTWDLNNLDKSGLPNSWSAGSVGGGYWYNSTTVFKIGRDKK